MQILVIFGADKQRYKRFRKLCLRLGIEGVHPYTLRHTCATRIVEITGGLAFAQAQLGHSRPTTTQRYAHYTPEMTDEAARALDRWGHRAAEI